MSVSKILFFEQEIDNITVYKQDTSIIWSLSTLKILLIFQYYAAKYYFKSIVLNFSTIHRTLFRNKLSFFF